MSAAKIAIKESERRYRRGAQEPEQTKRQWMVWAGVGFFVLAIVIIAAIIFFPKKDRGDDNGKIKAEQPIIFADKIDGLDVSGLDKKAALLAIESKIKNSDLRLGSINRIVLESGGSAISPADFFGAIGANPPSELLRFLRKEFLFGVHAFGSNSGFLILKVDSFDHAYAALLAWEKDSFAHDMAPVFNMTVRAADAGGYSFSDKVVKNVDTRILLNGSGETAMLYGFLDDNTLVFAANENTWTEILVRFTTPSQMIR